MTNSNTKSAARLVRPCVCAVCGQAMHYQGDPGHEPEVKVTVQIPKWQDAVEIKNAHSPFGITDYYIHVRCWNSLPIQLRSSKPDRTLDRSVTNLPGPL